MHAPHGRMRKLLALKAFALKVQILGRSGLLEQRERALHIAQSLAQKGEFVVETSSRVVEGLVRHG